MCVLICRVLWGRAVCVCGRTWSINHGIDPPTPDTPIPNPNIGYHFPEGPYVEYEGDMPPKYAAEPAALVAALNAEMARLVEEGAATEVCVCGFMCIDRLMDRSIPDRLSRACIE